jgi:hypothetical protein
MITKQQLLDSIRHETEIIKHLATKIPKGGYDYRPTPGQRSTLELMQYMTIMGTMPAVYAVTDSWDHAEKLYQEAAGITPQEFGAAMDAQQRRIEEALAQVDESEATTRPSAMPWGAPTTQAAGLMDMVLKCFVAYRMQLFLYAKAAGNHDLGSANCWAGVDRVES